jgi:hypothetical protein
VHHLCADGRGDFPRRFAAPGAAEASPQQGFPRRRAPGRGPRRHHRSACAWSADCSGQVKQITADLILLDDLLFLYGPETQPIRVELRAAIGPLVDRIWSEKRAGGIRTFVPGARAQDVYENIQALVPRNDVQRSIQSRAVQVSNDFAQTRLLLFVESDNLVPAPFLAIMVFWLVIIFASFSLFSELNATVFAFLALFAFSASCALFLILELSQPFVGLMAISSAPLHQALAPL